MREEARQCFTRDLGKTKVTHHQVVQLLRNVRPNESGKLDALDAVLDVRPLAIGLKPRSQLVDCRSTSTRKTCAVQHRAHLRARARVPSVGYDTGSRVVNGAKPFQILAFQTIDDDPGAGPRRCIAQTGENTAEARAEPRLAGLPEMLGVFGNDVDACSALGDVCEASVRVLQCQNVFTLLRLRLRPNVRRPARIAQRRRKALIERNPAGFVFACAFDLEAMRIGVIWDTVLDMRVRGALPVHYFRTAERREVPPAVDRLRIAVGLLSYRIDRTVCFDISSHDRTRADPHDR